MNIDQGLLDYGVSKQLCLFPTGGGIDYLVDNSIKGFLFVLHDSEDAGSPDSLLSLAEICLYSECDEQWSEPIKANFTTAKLAIDTLTTSNLKRDMIDSMFRIFKNI